jgi:hypothetical protein
MKKQEANDGADMDFLAAMHCDGTTGGVLL